MKHLFISALIALTSLPALAGATYKFRSVTEPGKSELAGTVSVEGARIRVEFTKGDQLFFRSGTVIISSDGGKTLYVVDASNKSYTPVNIEQLFANVMSMVKSMPGMFDIAVSDQKVDVKPLGMSGQLHGFPTQRYLVKSSYNMKMMILGTPSAMRVESFTEAWTTDKISRDYITFVQMKGFKTGLTEVDRLLDSQANALKGFPLKQVITSRTTSKEKTQETKTTIEITEFKQIAVPASTFAIPSGYKKQDLRKLTLVD